ncbi:MAG: glycoside hydrolase [Clostridia bacterium]|nr:glycoside hydrolase [Clostridia bacterium]
MIGLVKQNRFISQQVKEDKLPTFTEAKDKLPQPVWQGHDDYIDCYFKAWQLAFGNLRKSNADTGFVSDYIDTAFNGCLFMWDSSFILMFGKYADRIFKFQSTLDNFYSHQHNDGFICREIHEETGKDRYARHDYSSTGPELMPWCEWEYYLNFGDKERLDKVFPPLMAYHRWMAEHRTWQDGSYFSSGWGCGMDNIPRLQDKYSPVFSHGHMVWVDTCMQELFVCNILMDMASELGKPEYIDELKTERDNLEGIINQKLWDEKSGFYYDLWKNGQLNMVRHIGAYWALISQCASVDRAQRMIAYLTDENEFATPHPIPALSKSDPHFEETGRYWCGGVWAPTNYMVLKGLDKYGKYTLAHQIAKKHLDNVVEVFKKEGTLFENYAPKGNEKGNPAKPDFVGWTGLVPISVLFEYVFGIKPDAKNNRIVWNIELTEKHGVEQYPFGTEGELTLMCEARQNADEKPQITFKSNIPLELEVRWGKDQTMIIKA